MNRFCDNEICLKLIISNVHHAICLLNKWVRQVKILIEEIIKPLIFQAVTSATSTFQISHNKQSLIKSSCFYRRTCFYTYLVNILKAAFFFICIFYILFVVKAFIHAHFNAGSNFFNFGKTSVQISLNFVSSLTLVSGTGKPIYSFLIFFWRNI